MATIEAYTTKAGRRYSVRYRRPDGKQTMKRGFARKVDAQRWSAENTVAMTRGAYVAPAAGRLSFEAAAEDWISTRHDLAASTLARYRGLVDQLNKQFGALPLNKVTRPLLREWVAGLVDAEAPAETVHKTVGVVRQVLQHAVDDQRLAANPADKLALPPIRPAEMRFLTLDQLRQLATAAGPDGAAIWTLGICGLRMGELAGLQHRAGRRRDDEALRIGGRREQLVAREHDQPLRLPILQHAPDERLPERARPTRHKDRFPVQIRECRLKHVSLPQSAATERFGAQDFVLFQWVMFSGAQPHPMTGSQDGLTVAPTPVNRPLWAPPRLYS